MPSNKLHFLGSSVDKTGESHDGASHCLVVLTQAGARELLRFHDEAVAMLERLNGPEAFKPSVEICLCPVELSFLTVNRDKASGMSLAKLCEDQSQMVLLPHAPRLYWDRAGDDERVEARSVLIDPGYGLRFRAMDKHSDTYFSSQTLTIERVRDLANAVTA